MTLLADRDDISEDLVPGEGAVTTLEQAKNELRRWVIGGVGALIALAMTLSFLLTLLRPGLAEYSVQFLQVVVGGLIGLAGTAVGFLFGRETM